MNAGSWIRSRLGRVASSGSIIPELEGLRFLAITGVLLHHVMSSYLIVSQRFGPVRLPEDWHLLAPQSRLISLNLHLYLAVPVFFAISGFVLALPFAKAYSDGSALPSVSRYYLRRLIRLEPPYVIACTVAFAAILLFARHRDPAGHFHVFLPHFIASLFYVHALIYGQASWVLGVAWSLEIELQFYLLVPLFSRIFAIRERARRRIVLVVLIVGCSLLSQYWIEPALHDRLRLSLANYLQFFFAGFLAADLYLNKKRGTGLDPLMSDMLALTSAAGIAWVLHFHPRLVWIVPLLLAAFFTGSLGGGRIGRCLRLTPFSLLGGMCYTIYLYHPLILQIMQPYTLRWSQNTSRLSVAYGIQCLIIIPVVYALSIPLFVFGERPFMQAARKIRLRARH